MYICHITAETKADRYRGNGSSTARIDQPKGVLLLRYLVGENVLIGQKITQFLEQTRLDVLCHNVNSMLIHLKGQHTFTAGDG